MSIELILTTGSKAGTPAPIQRGYYMIGRHAECQIRPKSRSVSRRHCLLHHGAHGLAILDLNSTRGTHVNEDKIEPQTWIPLHHGDQIRCGKVTFDVAIQKLVPAIAGANPAAGAATDAWQENDIANFLEAADDAEREQRYGQIKASGSRHDTPEQADGDLDAYADTPLENDDATPLESTGSHRTKPKTKTNGKAKAKRKQEKPPKIPRKKRRGPKQARQRFSFSFGGAGDGDQWKLLAAVVLAVTFLGFFGYQMYRHSAGPDIELLQQID